MNDEQRLYALKFIVANKFEFEELRNLRDHVMRDDFRKLVGVYMTDTNERWMDAARNRHIKCVDTLFLRYEYMRLEGWVLPPWNETLDLYSELIMEVWYDIHEMMKKEGAQ